MRFNTVPNWLTFGRVLALPTILVLGSYPGPGYGLTAALVFSAAAITDFLDGWLARRTGQVSEFGQLVDPIADKILTASAFVMLVHLGRVPAWAVALIISREFAVTGLRAHAGSRGKVIPADSAGKLKTIFQLLSIIALLVGRDMWRIPFLELGRALFAAAFVLTIWSGLRYFMEYLKAMRTR